MAVQSNEVYPTPCTTVPSITIAAASDKRYSLAGMGHAFEATYDEEGAATAERIFYVRSLRELRRVSTFGPPVGFFVFVAAGLALGAPRWFVIFFSVFLALSVLGPAFFYIARPLAAKRLARKYPVRRITLTPTATEITAGEKTAHVTWERVKHVWDAGDYVLLVLGKFASISIPKRSLPPGASEFILASVKNAG